MKKNYLLLGLFVVIATQPAAHAMLRGAARAVGAAAHDDAAVSRVARQFGRVTLSDGASAVGRGVARRAPARGFASVAGSAAQGAGQGVPWRRVAVVAAGGVMLIAGTAFGVQEYIFSRDDKGKFPIHHAVADGELERVRVLLLLGADPNVADFNGITPLHEAALRGDVEKIKLLLRFGASVNAENRDGRTPLLCAVSARNVGAVRVLLREGVKINHADGHGDSALHIAARIAFRSRMGVSNEGPDTEIFDLLLRFGADTSIKNATGKTPIEVFRDVEAGIAAEAKRVKYLDPDMPASYRERPAGLNDAGDGELNNYYERH